MGVAAAKVPGVAAGEAVEGPHVVAAALEEAGGVAADVAGAAGHQDAHGSLSLKKR